MRSLWLIGGLLASGTAACTRPMLPPLPAPDPAAAACPGFAWVVIDSAWTHNGAIYHPCDVDTPPVAAQGNPPPKYPAELRAQCIAGEALVRGVLDQEGRIEPATTGTISASHESFAMAALAVFRRYRFHPALKAGRPVRTMVAVPFAFRVQGCEVAPTGPER